MPTFIAFLRAINVGGKNKIAMADLRAVATSLGFSDVSTVLQTGNLVFSCAETSMSSLEVTLVEACEKATGVKCEFFVRRQSEMAKLVAANPFVEEGERDPSHLVVLFVKSTPSEDQVASLQPAIKGREEDRLAAGEVFAWYPDNIGDSKVTNAVLEKHLGTRVTGRNWNVVRKLATV